MPDRCNSGSDLGISSSFLLSTKSTTLNMAMSYAHYLDTAETQAYVDPGYAIARARIRAGSLSREKAFCEGSRNAANSGRRQEMKRKQSKETNDRGEKVTKHSGPQKLAIQRSSSEEKTERCHTHT